MVLLYDRRSTQRSEHVQDPLLFEGDSWLQRWLIDRFPSSVVVGVDSLRQVAQSQRPFNLKHRPHSKIGLTSSGFG